MNDTQNPGNDRNDIAPGERIKAEPSLWYAVRGYLYGFALSILLTVVAFASVHSTFVWDPAIPALLMVLAVAQMGVHLVFFLHIGTGPDSTNNVLALAFGVLIVGLLVGGSMWIMTNLNNHTMPRRSPVDAGAIRAVGPLPPANIA